LPEVEDKFLWSCLIEPDRVPKELEENTFRQFDFYPVTDNFKKNQKNYYSRFGIDGYEPHFFARRFPTKPRYIEISQEFVHFFGLFHDKNTDTFIRESDDGKEEVIAKISNEVAIKTKELKQFLAFKEMKLLIGFATSRYFNDHLDIPFEKATSQLIGESKTSEFHYHVWYQREVGKASFRTEILGKKIVTGMPVERTGLFPFEAEPKFASFIIGVDESGNEVEFTCSPDLLANYFGKNSANPHYLTPVFFTKDVLDRYYANPSKYKVEDGYIKIGAYSLRADTNHSEFVIVFLGDLGTDISFLEQQHWRLHNIAPQGQMSTTNFRRAFLGEFAEPEAEIFLLENALNQLRSNSEKSLGWPILKPLPTEDSYRQETLRVPTEGNQLEFDQSINNLNVLLIESINEAEIGAWLKKREVNVAKGARGIVKLDLFLSALGCDKESHIKFLKQLHGLRVTSSHRKSDDYQTKFRELGFETVSHPQVFKSLMQKAITFVDFLDRSMENPSI
jgi:hypothetical protein